MSKKTFYIIILTILISLFMSFIDSIQTTYILKSLMKIFLFLTIPILYSKLFRDKTLKQILKFNDFHEFMTAISFGLSICLCIISVYFGLKMFMDFSGITAETLHTTTKTFIFRAIYISFINSFLEEFFFRGFAFYCLKQKINRKIAYVFSAFMFAIYHAGMTFGWFHMGIYVLMLFGLFLVGLFLDYIAEETDNIMVSWIFHMFANIGINTIGIMLIR